MRRQILGKIYETDDTPFKSGVVVFLRSTGSYTPTTQYPPDLHVCRTDTSGNLVDCFLWCNQQGDLISNYTAKINGKDVFTISVPVGDGSPIQLSVLRAGSQPTENYPQSIIDYIDNAVAGVVAGKAQNLTVQAVATQNYSALRVINLETMGYADSNNISSANASLCFLKDSATVNAPFNGITQGVVKDNFFNWQNNTVLYLGNNGFLTANLPANAVFIRAIANSIAPNSIFFNPSVAIIL
jgi:hypothetical protein